MPQSERRARSDAERFKAEAAKLAVEGFSKEYGCKTEGWFEVPDGPLSWTQRP